MTKEIIFDEKPKNDRKLKNRLQYFNKGAQIGKGYEENPSVTGQIDGEKFMAFERTDSVQKEIAIIQNRKSMEYNGEDSSHILYTESTKDEQGWHHQLRLNIGPTMQSATENMQLETPMGNIILTSRIAEDEEDFRTESKVHVTKGKGMVANYLLRATYKEKKDYIEQKLPIKITLIMNNGKEGLGKYYMLQEDGQYLAQDINPEKDEKNEMKTFISLEDIKKLIENKEISFEMPKALEQYITGTYDIPEEVKIIAEEIEKRKLDKNTVGEEMEH